MNLKNEKLQRAYSVKEGLAEFAVKDVDTVGRVVTGFFNTYNYMDSDGDILLMGCAKKSIEERGAQAQSVAKIKHALFHDLTRLPGKIQVLEEKEVSGMSGIYFETKMSKTVEGNDTLTNYLDGVYDNHSIGFRYLQLEALEKDTDGFKKALDMVLNPKDAQERDVLYVVKEIALYEGSTVAFGANKLTPFLGVKSESKEAMQMAVFTRIDKIKNTLKNGKQSDETMHLLELQLLQLKQIFHELHFETSEPSLKDTARPSKSATDSTASNGIDFTYLVNNFKLK